MLAGSFYPKSDAGSGYGGTDASLPSRPKETGPILDAISSTIPLLGFNSALHEQSYEPGTSSNGTSKMPVRRDGFSDPYLYPMLTRNERLRLTMLWYYTRDLVNDEEVLSKMQHKVLLLRSLIGWEFAICGLLENDIYRRLATAGLPLAILPRRESTCAHTVQQAADSVFFISDMSNDWRFAQSPHVSQGGLRTYAGAQLRCRVDNGQDIALGSLCIASNTPNQKLDPSQLDMLVKFADMLTEDIVNGSRRRRARQQEHNDILLREAFTESFGNPTDAAIMRIMDQVFPEAQINILPIKDSAVQLQAGGPLIAFSQLNMKSATWEDHNLIDELLQTSNHEKLKAARPVRAIIGMIQEKSTYTALVVSTNDITRIFDDVDVRFVEGCAMILRGIAQERTLQDALKTRERFMRGITHQLRTPIHGILGSVDLLADETTRSNLHDTSARTTSEIVTENLRMIKSSGMELMSTVNNVIKFNRWADVVSTPKVATLSDLSLLESEILEDISWLLPEEKLDHVSIFFLNKLPVEVGLVQIDTTLLKECLQSLVLNALQNTVQGSVVITVSTTPDYSSIALDVQDTGCGIALSDQQRIFDAYEKADTHSAGSGLGLTLACNIADTLGGALVLVSSVLERGSHFRAEFQNPGFACLRKSTKEPLPTVSALPERFAIIPTDPPSILDQHFAEHLVAQGLQQTGDVTGALAIVSFTQLDDQYHGLLRLAAKSLVAISLVPAGKDLTKAKETHPEILFFSGPFTSRRLDEILSETGVRYASLHPPANTDQTPESTIESETRPAVTPLGGLTKPSLSSQLPQSFVPNCLLVDDNLINMRIMRMYCDKRNYPSASAYDGLQAIELYKEAAKKTPIDLILLDLQMPKCGGIEACEEIRSFEATESLSSAAIFIITGQDSPDDRTRSFAAGADKFFVKPLALKSLDRGVAEMFSKARKS